MASERKLFVKILCINCFFTDELGFDEIYLLVHGKKIWPENEKYIPVKSGRTEVNVAIGNLESNSELEIEIWDFDYLSANDLLGRVQLLVDEPGGPYTTDMVPNVAKTIKAKYSLVWEIDYE